MCFGSALVKVNARRLWGASVLLFPLEQRDRAGKSLACQVLASKA
jgi:hypothetical protein